MYVLSALVALALGVYAFRLLPEPAPGSRDSAAAARGEPCPMPTARRRASRNGGASLLVVNFWATWCAPCREEMPMFVRAQAAHGAKGLQFVGIAVDDAVKVRQFAREIGLNYPALIGGYGAMELSKTLGNSRDGAAVHHRDRPQGQRRAHATRPVREAQLERLVADFL